MADDNIHRGKPPVATLSLLVIGSLVLSPAFASGVFEYTATTTNATNKITADTLSGSALIVIEVNGVAHVNGAAANWLLGDNTVVITVTNGVATEVYEITVTKS